MRAIHQRITTLQGEYVQNFERARGRFVAVIMFFSLAFIIVSFRLVYLMGPDILSPEAAAAPPVAEAPAPKRLNIVDRHGMLLATSLETKSLYADPKYMDDATTLVSQLKTVFPDLDAENTIAELERPNRRFVWIKRHLTPRQQAAVLEIGDPALNVETEYKRVYPQGNLLAHIIGYTNTDGNGIAGLEKQYNDRLLNDKTPLKLTIDLRLQDVLRTEILKSMTDFNAIGGSGMVMDVKNGEILSMVSLPDFDPHDYSKADQNAMFNRNTVGVYEMGSTFKTFTTAAALEHKSTTLGKKYDVKKPLKISRFRINDYHPFKRDITMTEVFIHSSNIGTAQMALEMGGEKLQAFFSDLGFMDRAVIDLPERGSPIVPNPWREVHTITSSYGHGIAVSPVHLMRGMAAMVNGGSLPYPHLVDSPDLNKKPQVAVISPETSDTVAGLLALTVDKGTGSKAAHSDVWVGGKTGTAEKISGRGGYNRKSLFSSFVGVFPADNPRYVIFVAIDEPQGTKASFGYATGGWTSAPVVGKVIEYMKPSTPELNAIEKKPFPTLDFLATYVSEED